MEGKYILFTRTTSIKRWKTWGFFGILLILAVVPLTIYILNRQTQENTKAAPATPSPLLSLNPPLASSLSSPSATAAPLDTFASVTIVLAGINTNSFGNAHPLHPTRSITISLYDPATQHTFSSVDTVRFDGSTTFTNNHFKLGTVPTADYQVFIKVPQFAKKQVPPPGNTDAFFITSGTTISLPSITPLAGDIAPIPGKNNESFGDDQIDVSDYNMLLGCYSDIAPPLSCDDVTKLAADLDDDGKVSAEDYNLLLRSFAAGSQPTATSSATISTTPRQ